MMPVIRRHTYRHKDRHAYIQAPGTCTDAYSTHTLAYQTYKIHGPHSRQNMNIQTDKNTDIQTTRQTDIHKTDKQTDRHTDMIDVEKAQFGVHSHQ